MLGERLGLVGVSTWGVCRDTLFNGAEYKGCLQRDFV